MVEPCWFSKARTGRVGHSTRLKHNEALRAKPRAII
jgi:hypothetical protein